MEPIYTQPFHINDSAVDRYGRLKPSMILFYAQEVAGRHAYLLGAGYDALQEKHLFWAIIRNRVQITRLPMSGETITVQTWPMPTTRTAYPRSVVAYDEQGSEIFRCISLWVLMDTEKRAMILPGKSGVTVSGTLQGGELALPGSLVPRTMDTHRARTVCFTDLDRNGHMNNTRYFDWIFDLLPSTFHREHPVSEFTICYLSEAREGQALDMSWELGEALALQVEGTRTLEDGAAHRIFAAKIQFA